MGCRGHFPVLCGWFVLPASDRSGAAIVAVADVVGMEGLSAAVLSEAGPAAEPSDCASEPHNKQFAILAAQLRNCAASFNTHRTPQCCAALRSAAGPAVRSTLRRSTQRRYLRSASTAVDSFKAFIHTK